MSPDGRLSRDSSISLEDHNGPAPRLSRSDLYTAHQIQREANNQASLDFLFMIPLDFPATYNAEEMPTGVEPSDPVDEPSLSSRRLGHYLSEEQSHESILLGVQPLGVNKATVQNYLPEIIQSVDSNESQAEATVGTIEPDEGVCWGSFTTLTSTTSDGSPGPIRVCNNDGDVDYLDEATNSGPLLPTTSSDQYIAPGSAELGKADVAPIKSEHVLDPELEAIVRGRHIKMSSHKGNRHERCRVGKHVGKQARVLKIVRQRRRSKEPEKEMAK